MRDENKTKSQLISELQELHRRLQNCEQAEAEIHRLASFPQLNPNPVVELDATGAVTFCNEAALATLKSLDESAGPEAFFPPDLEDILQAAWERGERSFSREVRIKEAVFAIDISYAAPFEVLRLYTRDITERKRAEGALRETQKDLNRAQAVAHTGSWRLNIQRNELLWSDETYRIFGLPQGRPLTYESFLTAVHPEDRDYVDRKWQAALRGEAYDLEHRIMVGDTVKWVRERAELEFDPQGALIGGFGTVQDVTERKRGEAALRESEERLRLLIKSCAS
jgi:two-component system CheB/CheR fusion protein